MADFILTFDPELNLIINLLIDRLYYLFNYFLASINSFHQSAIFLYCTPIRVLNKVKLVFNGLLKSVLKDYILTVDLLLQLVDKLVLFK